MTKKSDRLIRIWLALTIAVALVEIALNLYWDSLFGFVCSRLN
jgi:hypothetical protein